MFPANRLPIPVYVVYDCRGRRARKWFENGLGREARAFYAAKLKAGKNPKVVKAEPDTQGKLFTGESPDPSADGAAGE